MKKHCLVLDQDPEHAQALNVLCTDIGFDVLLMSSLEETRAAVSDNDITVAFIDLNAVEDGGGMKLLRDGTLDDVEAVFMAEHDNPQLANEAIRNGASYFFCKPFNVDLITPILQDIAEELDPSEASPEEGQPCAVDQFGYLRGSSKRMRKLYRLLRKVSQTNASLMIVGESGTGKELVAETVHALSARADKPLIAINSAAMAENLAESELFGHEKGSFTGAKSLHRGFFERADGGTLFLDEITEMDINLQAKLLRVLETQKVRRLGSEEDISIDVRFISATNRSPEQAVRDGKLREDLYYRLAQFPVPVPALRDRAGDVGGLAQYFLNTLNEKHSTDIAFTAEALEILRARDWPGNVRELKHYVEKAYILSESLIKASVLPSNEPVLRPESELEDDEDLVVMPVGSSLEDMTKKLIEATLERNGGDKKRTAEELGVSLKTLYNRLKEYEEAPEDEEEAPSQCEILPDSSAKQA